MDKTIKSGAVNAEWAERAVPWLDCFTIGEQAIDDEHRHLITCCNALCALAAAGADCVAARDLIAALTTAVNAHFASEEALFPRIAFPDPHGHRREHQAIRRALAGLLDHADGNTDFRAAVATVRLILVEHIIRHDLALKTFVEEARGL